MARYYEGFPPYVSVAKRKAQAARKITDLKKKGNAVQPVTIDGRTITKTFWGKAWCTHLESYSDYANRLPRGRTYVRNGSVIDLQISSGEIKALVSGSAIYKINISISSVKPEQWKKIVTECAGKIDSLIELLQGRFSKGVMEIITHPDKGLFPQPKEIKLDCSCPDWADMCKHVAAVLYGVGARLDNHPEDLFLLRQADHSELITQAGKASSFVPSTDTTTPTLADSDLSALFGIDMDETTTKPAVRKKLAGAKKRLPAVTKKLPIPKKKMATKKLVKKSVKKVETKKAIKKSIKKISTKKPAAKKAATRRMKKSA